MNKNGLLASLIIVSLLFVGSISFAVWAYAGRQDYKNNVDTKIDEAVVQAEEVLTVKKDAEFAEEYKNPFIIYKGPSAYGTITITYPKTWSNYVKQDESSTLLDGFMAKDVVPANVEDTNYALRYQVTSSSYDQELKRFESPVKKGITKAYPYASPKQPNARAIRLEGEVDNKKQGVLIMIELRDKTIKIWTEGDTFKADFDKILQELTFIQ